MPAFSTLATSMLCFCFYTWCTVDFIDRFHLIWILLLWQIYYSVLMFMSKLSYYWAVWKLKLTPRCIRNTLYHFCMTICSEIEFRQRAFIEIISTCRLPTIHKSFFDTTREKRSFKIQCILYIHFTAATCCIAIFQFWYFRTGEEIAGLILFKLHEMLFRA